MKGGNLASPGVVIVNYNSLSYSLEAIASVLDAEQLSGKIRIVLVDNASTSHTFEDLVQSARQRLQLPVVCGRQNGRRVILECDSDETASLFVIKAESNEGFAAGCNIGLRFLYETDTDYFLLLNPDALLEKDALKAFAWKLSSDKSYGLVGATLLNEANPHYAQACGGASLNGWSLLGKNLGQGILPDELPLESEVEKTLSYPVGAALAFRRDWLEYAGYMDERYFLYYEEMDWVNKGRDKYKPGWARSAVVYHHHGAVAGSNISAQHRSPLADYHMIRSRMLFAFKWYPWLIPVMMGLGLIQALRRFLRGQKEQARAVLRATLPRAARRFSSG